MLQGPDEIMANSWHKVDIYSVVSDIFVERQQNMFLVKSTEAGAGLVGSETQLCHCWAMWS